MWRGSGCGAQQWGGSVERGEAAAGVEHGEAAAGGVCGGSGGVWLLYFIAPV